MSNLQFIHMTLCCTASGTLFGTGTVLFIVTRSGIGIFTLVLGLVLGIYSIRKYRELYK